MSRAICVYCSASTALDLAYTELATQLGQQIAARGETLVFGGTNIGLMSTLAQAVKGGGGRVIGVIPVQVQGTPYAFDAADELIATPTLRERKAVMEQRADAFIALPGGFGTLDEVIEVIMLKQVQFHKKPIVLLDHAGFYQPLSALFEHLYAHRFASAEHHRPLYHLAGDVASAYAYLDAYQAPEFPIKWF
jgi:uncharacterized protein (TIGR00730 family)